MTKYLSSLRQPRTLAFLGLVVGLIGVIVLLNRQASAPSAAEQSPALAALTADAYTPEWAPFWLQEAAANTALWSQGQRICSTTVPRPLNCQQIRLAEQLLRISAEPLPDIGTDPSDPEVLRQLATDLEHLRASAAAKANQR